MAEFDLVGEIKESFPEGAMTGNSTGNGREEGEDMCSRGLKRASVTGEVQQVSEVQAVPGKGESEAPRVQILGRHAFEGWCKCKAWIGE